MEWIKISEENKPEIGDNFLCRFIEKINPHQMKEHIYFCHISCEGHYHVRQRPYEDCWNMNIQLMRPTHFLLINELKLGIDEILDR